MRDTDSPYSRVLSIDREPFTGFANDSTLVTIILTYEFLAQTVRRRRRHYGFLSGRRREGGRVARRRVVFF